MLKTIEDLPKDIIARIANDVETENLLYTSKSFHREIDKKLQQILENIDRYHIHYDEQDAIQKIAVKKFLHEKSEEFIRDSGEAKFEQALKEDNPTLLSNLMKAGMIIGLNKKIKMINCKAEKCLELYDTQINLLEKISDILSKLGSQDNEHQEEIQTFVKTKCDKFIASRLKDEFKKDIATFLLKAVKDADTRNLDFLLKHVLWIHSKDVEIAFRVAAQNYDPYVIKVFNKYPNKINGWTKKKILDQVSKQQDQISYLPYRNDKTPKKSSLLYVGCYFISSIVFQCVVRASFQHSQYYVRTMCYLVGHIVITGIINRMIDHETTRYKDKSLVEKYLVPSFIYHHSVQKLWRPFVQSLPKSGHSLRA